MKRSINEASGSGCSSAGQMRSVTTRSMVRLDPSLRPASLRPPASKTQHPPTAPKLTPEERELDTRFHQKLLQRQQVVYQSQYVASLQDLALNAAGNLLDDATYFRVEHGFLAGLPAPLLSGLQNRVSDLDDREVQLQLITEASEEVKIKFTNRRLHNPWKKDHIPVLMELLEKCQGKLKHLSVKHHSTSVYLTLDQLNHIISKQANLQKLRLSRCDINDDTMAIIASTCKNLRVLNVSDNREVTDVGLLAVCDNCPNIKVLDIDYTSFSLPCAARLISQLPHLEHICMSNSYLPEPQQQDRGPFYSSIYKVVEAILLIARENPTFKWQNFRTLILSFNHKKVSDNFEVILSMVPNVIDVSLSSCTDIKPLNYVKEIKELSLRGASGYHDISAAVLVELPNIVNKFAHTLTSVSISGKENSQTQIDISLFAMCENLEELDVCNFCFQHTDQHKITPTSFNKLVTVGLDSNRREYSIRDDLMIKIMSSSKLTDFSISSIILPENLLKSLCTQASIHGEIFAKIQYFCIRNVLQPYSLDTMLDLVCVLPNAYRIGLLKDMTSTENGVKLKAFTRRHNIKVGW